MEKDEITERLQKLEAEMQVSSDYRESLKTVLFQLMELLHQKGIVRMQEVADKAEALAAFGQAGFRQKPPDTLELVLLAIRVIGDELDKR